MNPILILALAAGGIFFASKGNAAKKLQFYFRSIKLTGTIVDPKLDYIMDIVNPTQTALKVDTIFANVFMDETQIGRIEVNKSFDIAKAGTSVIGIPIKLQTGKGIAALIKAIYEKRIPTIKVIGTINSGGIPVALNESYNLSL